MISSTEKKGKKEKEREKKKEEKRKRKEKIIMKKKEEEEGEERRKSRKKKERGNRKRRRRIGNHLLKPNALTSNLHEVFDRYKTYDFNRHGQWHPVTRDQHPQCLSAGHLHEQSRVGDIPGHRSQETRTCYVS
jgi:hypothetical protein